MSAEILSGMRQVVVVVMVTGGQTHSNRDGGLVVQILQFVHMSRKKRLLNEERAVRLELLGKLLGHCLVDTAVEVEAGIETDALDLCEALDSLVKGMWRVEPSDRLGRVHLDLGEALGLADLGLLQDIRGTVTAWRCEFVT